MDFLKIGKLLLKALVYTVHFRWVVDITRWMIYVGGTIAESAFVLSTTYVIVSFAMHPLLLAIVPGGKNTLDSINQLVLVAFSALPELILIAAIASCYEMWRLTFRTKNIETGVWSFLFTLPTIVFTVMTLRIASGFVSLESTGQQFTISGPDLQWRVVSGWFYGAVQMLYAKIGRGTLDSLFDDLRNQIAIATGTLAERENTIVALQSTIGNLESNMTSLQSDIENLRIANAQKKYVSRRKNNFEGEQGEYDDTHTHTHTEKPSSGSGKREKLKALMKKTIIKGEKLNLKQIADAAGVSYNMARQHRDAILKEITSEHPTLTLVKEA